MCACRSHKESDLRVAEMQQTQTAETVQKRTDSRSETQTEQTEAADSIAWTVTADSVVQTAVDARARCCIAFDGRAQLTSRPRPPRRQQPRSRPIRHWS